ncbi:hypothetical protein HOU03_gp055 [Caulobacter phage CcrSC]|uniref:DNA/pantothenate metabolism flavoprotein C-terminal domain-containing protein n=1 Tax=Caulobacter phage CcrSC TaxID=2283272 RepID=A0A385EFR2_9CAUD|nr:hypothetical protein HOU03_gp055 [Caulobacter phage CcrSC]AXQ69637.1 hypothetical protein CcrSC_gp055c [Caulobacter phage CcrSC]
MDGKIHILGGGTFAPVRNHLSLAAQAFGGAAKKLHVDFSIEMEWHMRRNKATYEAYYAHPLEERHYSLYSRQRVKLHLTKMADPYSKLVYNSDVKALLDKLLADPETKMIVMSAALCDYEGSILKETSGDSHDDWGGGYLSTKSGPHETRLKTEDGWQMMRLTPADKLIGSIRKTRPDVFVVGFKTTTGASPEEQLAAGFKSLQGAGTQLVLANDTVTRNNMVIGVNDYAKPTYESGDRDGALRVLAEVAFNRCAIFQAPPVDAGF